MDPREILMIVDVVSREKDLEKEIIFQAVEAALARPFAQVTPDTRQALVAYLM